jgi:pyrimidine-specific ribonucleoside hydrolase
MVVLRFLQPGIFSYEPSGDGDGAVRCDVRLARARYLNLLSGDLSLRAGHRAPVVLRRFPTDPALLRGDVAESAWSIIERHGDEEWNAALIANELHRHLGIYSILGVKMAIRAREILNAGVDALRVVSYAGTEPPLSCMTDGLQVGTGATLGRGTITVDPKRSEAAARFTRDGRSITLTVKESVRRRIMEDIAEALSRHGPGTAGYWSAVRAMALRYWLEMDRDEVFVETPADEPSRR